MLRFLVFAIFLIFLFPQVFADAVPADKDPDLQAAIHDNKPADDTMSIYDSVTAKSEPVSTMRNVQSPLKQFDSGVKWYEVQCLTDKVIIQRDTYPACVNFDTAITLYKRGVVTNMENDVWNKWAQNVAQKYFDLNLAKSYIIEENSFEIGLVGVRESLPPLVTIGIHFTSNDGGQKIPHDFWFGISNGDHIDKILESTDDGKTQTELRIETSEPRKTDLILDNFKNLSFESQTRDSLFSKFGQPVSDIGSGIHIYVYKLDDSTQVWIGYTDHILYVRHVDSAGNTRADL